MSEITKYHIFSNENYIELCNEVNLAIQDGWQPLGGVSAANVIDAKTEKISTMFYQAIVEYSEDKSHYDLG
jgi:hypothetical protein